MPAALPCSASRHSPCSHDCFGYTVLRPREGRWPRFVLPVLGESRHVEQPRAEHPPSRPVRTLGPRGCGHSWRQRALLPETPPWKAPRLGNFRAEADFYFSVASLGVPAIQQSPTETPGQELRDVHYHEQAKARRVCPGGWLPTRNLSWHQYPRCERVAWFVWPRQHGAVPLPPCSRAAAARPVLLRSAVPGSGAAAGLIATPSPLRLLIKRLPFNCGSCLRFRARRRAE